MSFETISIVRHIPIVNGFVQLANNLEKNKTAISVATLLASDPTLTLERVTADTGPSRLAGLKHGLQEWIELPAEVVSCCPASEASEDAKNQLPSNVAD